MAKRREDLPQSGTPGIRWSEAHGRWMVRFKDESGAVRYLGLFERDALDEAKEVLAAARVEHGDKPQARGHDDSTAHLSDAEIAKHFALDDEDDPVWRDRPLVGSEAEIREAARWNSRHGGKKLDERAKLVGARHMWRSDIVARLVAISDAQPDEAAAEPIADDPVATDWKQGSGIPQAGAYEAKLAEAIAIEDVLEREAQATALEGEIIPPTPIGKGPLALVLMKAKREYGLRQDELRVLSSGKDPFHQDTPMGHTLGRWLKVRLDLHAAGRIIHLRGVHYILVSVQAVKPDGSPYQNTAEDYRWLNDRVAKAARWLRFIPFDHIIDERNEEVAEARLPRTLPPTSLAYVSTGYLGRDVFLPAPLTIHSAEARPALVNFKTEEKYCFAVSGEKSSLKEVLDPFAERHHADLFIATGELSESRAYEMARAAVRDGRKLIVFVFSDFDPSGMQMAVSISVKLMAQQVLQFPDFRFAVVRVGLTLADVIRLRLPTAMVEKKDTRTKLWQQTFAPPLIEAGLLPESARWTAADDAEERTTPIAKGEQRKPKPLAQVEIDALVGTNPAELTRMAEAAIAPYRDRTLAPRAAEAERAWLREAEPVVRDGVDHARLNTLSRIQRFAVANFNRLLTVIGRAKDSIEAIAEAMSALVRHTVLPPTPEPPKAEPLEDGAAPLVDSDWGYLGMVKALKASKQYEDED